jgi:FkbM family methyltransferase
MWNALKKLVRLGDHLPKQRLMSFMEWVQIHSTLQRYAINLVVDVGASRGQFARNLRQIGYQGFICSFEPIPEEFARLEELMGADPRWKGYQLALGREDKRALFNVAAESTVMSSFLRHKDRNAQIRKIEVSVRRLDSLEDELLALVSEPRILLKLDTQGFDLEVVKGGLRCMEHVLCLQSEIAVDHLYNEMPHYLDALQRYETLGFQLAGLFEVARNPSQETVIEMNCLMVRPEYAVSD